MGGNDAYLIPAVSLEANGHEVLTARSRVITVPFTRLLHQVDRKRHAVHT